VTPRLYFEDPLLLAFRARVVAHGEIHRRPTAVLDRTAFCPESGGQLADRGALDGRTIVDVQEDDAGAVHHLVDGELPAPGAEVEGTVDRARRRVHMALHTGQHVLSRALVECAGAETASSRLGESGCTIDVPIAIGEGDVARSEDLTNSVVDDDLPIRAFFPTDAELSLLPLRRAPKVTDGIRVVRIGDFDVTPCGGTHCTRTAQIGLVRVTGVERYKGGTRVTFDAGARARTGLAAEAGVLRTLGRQLTCAPGEVPAAFDRLRRDLGEAREGLGQAHARIADAMAQELLAAAKTSGDPHMVGALDGAPVELLRAVASRLTTLEDGVALLAGPAADGTAIVVARGPKSAFDCGAFVKRVAAESGGRGGGRPERAEGRLPAGVDWPAVARRLIG